MLVPLLNTKKTNLFVARRFRKLFQRLMSVSFYDPRPNKRFDTERIRWPQSLLNKQNMAVRKVVRVESVK
jgi:hypothetical protein